MSDDRRDDSFNLPAAHAALRDGLFAAGCPSTTGRYATTSPAAPVRLLRLPGQDTRLVRESRRGPQRRKPFRHRSDLLTLVTPVAFSGYSAELKKAVNHVIPVLLPSSRTIDGDTRRTMRYDSHADLLAAGVVDADGAARGLPVAGTDGGVARPR